MLAATEGWVGFSSYGMQSLLVLYMTGRLLRPDHLGHVWGFGPFLGMLGLLYGPLAGEPLASAIMGLYSALIYASPILAGLLADRVLGRTRTIVLGAVLMTAGHFMMAFDESFLLALACLVAGLGCAGSLAAQVGALYGPDDLRRADGFQIWSLSVSLAVIVAPLVCGGLAQSHGWSWGFAAAGAGMLIGLLVYLAGRRLLPPEPPLARRSDRAARPALGRQDRRRLAVLALLLPVLAVAMVGNMQIFNAYLVWGQQHYALVVFGHAMPVSWLLSLDAFIGCGTLLLSVLFWRWWGRHRPEPDEITKLACGSAILALAPLILALASWQAHGQKIGLGWGLAFHLVDDVGFANVYAVGLALFARAAPAGLNATVINAYSLHLFLSNLLVGWLGGLLDIMSPVRFWLLHAGLIGCASVLLLLLGQAVRRILAQGPETELVQAGA